MSSSQVEDIEDVIDSVNSIGNSDSELLCTESSDFDVSIANRNNNDIFFQRPIRVFQTMHQQLKREHQKAIVCAAQQQTHNLSGTDDTLKIHHISKAQHSSKSQKLVISQSIKINVAFVTDQQITIK